ncbi:helix-turn-helix domain-containing protein [Aureibacillus halotolerans]|uniref:XRE family transcriptional regulator n=1 Tax=Aureibacillus halotolerans TaxID=1508390 RepID=A0A4R6TYA3_9BACI|nr:XRE family transcriptional regulator [Aureibacillus halotolerans]TDQ38296.1 XRE family transcriptional regulator [Aureibacillus halotolerans]
MDQIYRKIRDLRQRNKMTLKDLSDRTSLSVSFLSQIERGSSSLAIHSLQKIAEAFEVNIGYFFEEQDRYNYVMRQSQKKPFQIKGFESEYIRLNGEFTNRSLAPFEIIMKPHQKKTNTFTHPGEEFYYVLEGAMIYTLDDKEYYLKKGESIHFPSTIPHYGENPLDKETKLLCVITPVIF